MATAANDIDVEVDAGAVVDNDEVSHDGSQVINESRLTDPKAMVATLSAMHEADEISRVNIDALLKGVVALKQSQVLALNGDKEGALLLLGQIDNIELLTMKKPKSVSQKAKLIAETEERADKLLDELAPASSIEPIQPDWSDVIGGIGEGVKRQLYALKGGDDDVRSGCFVYYIADPYTFDDDVVQQALQAAEDKTGAPLATDTMDVDGAILVEAMEAFCKCLLEKEFEGLDRPTFTEGDIIEPALGTPWDEVVNSMMEPVRSIVIQARQTFMLIDENEIEMGKLAYRLGEQLKPLMDDYRGNRDPIG